jgi:hypothetical protein
MKTASKPAARMMLGSGANSVKRSTECDGLPWVRVVGLGTCVCGGAQTSGRSTFKKP